MTLLEALAVLLAGTAAGTLNTVVGSGTLVTFPVLLSVGYPPLVANVSSGIGLVPGSVSGAIGYRRELAGQRARAVRLGAASAAGGLTGGVLLLVLPESAFEAIVPAFIVVALVLIVAQPRLTARVAARRASAAPGSASASASASAAGGPGTRLAVYGTGIYGGYFGAAQGIMLIAVLGTALDEDLHRINALKNVLAGLVNLVSGLLFVLVAEVAWEAVALIAAGSVAGGQLGARYGRRLPPAALRAVIVVVGATAVAQLLLG